jgi:hypothetical protein
VGKRRASESRDGRLEAARVETFTWITRRTQEAGKGHVYHILERAMDYTVFSYLHQNIYAGTQFEQYTLHIV